MSREKSYSLAVLGPSGSGKTTYITALMHYFYESSDWVIHPDLAASQFYRDNIVSLQKGEFPSATMEEKPLSFEIVSKDGEESHRISTRDFRGSDLREWLEGRQGERIKAIESYFANAQAYLLLLSPGDLDPENREKYQRDLALFEKALEEAYRQSEKSGVAKPLALAITKVDAFPQIQKNPGAFVENRLKRLQKYLDFYSSEDSQVFTLSAVGKEKVKQVEENPPQYAIKGEIDPLQVEEPLFFLFRRLEERKKKLRRLGWIKRGWAALALVLLYLAGGGIWGAVLSHRTATASYEEAEEFCYFFPLHNGLLGIEKAWQERREDEIRPLLRWAKKEYSQRPYDVQVKMEKKQGASFLSPPVKEEIHKLQRRARQEAWKSLVEMERRFERLPRAYEEVYRAYEKFHRHFPHFEKTKVQSQMEKWKKRSKDRSFWKIYWQIKEDPSQIENLKGGRQLLSQHLKEHNSCPFSEKGQKLLLSLEYKICEKRLKKIRHLPAADPYQQLKRYREFLANPHRCSRHVEEVNREIQSISNRLLAGLEKEIQKSTSPQRLGKILDRSSNLYPHSNPSRARSFRQKLWSEIKSRSQGRDYLELLDYLQEYHRSSLEACGLKGALKEEKSRVISQSQREEHKKLFQSFRQRLARKNHSLKTIQILWNDVRKATEEKVHLEAAGLLLEKIALKWIEISQGRDDSVEKVQKSIYSLEDLKRELRRLPQEDSLSPSKKVTEKLSRILASLRKKMYALLPVYLGSDREKLKKYRDSLLLFIRTNPDSELVARSQKEKKQVEHLLALEGIIQNSENSPWKKLKAIEKKFFFVQKRSHPRLYQRIREFEKSLLARRRRAVKEEWKEFQKDWKDFAPGIKEVEKYPAFRKRLKKARSLERELGQLISFLKKRGQKAPELSVKKKKIRRQHQRLHYWYYRIYLSDNDFGQALKIIASYLQEFPQGRRKSELLADQKRLKRIIKKSTYRVTIHRGDLPEIGYETPDAYVVVKVGNQKYGQTGVERDKWYPSWGETIQFKWRYGETFQLLVYDRDHWTKGGGSDLLGTYSTTSPYFLESFDWEKRDWRPKKNREITITLKEGHKIKIWVSFHYGS